MTDKILGFQVYCLKCWKHQSNNNYKLITTIKALTIYRHLLEIAVWYHENFRFLICHVEKYQRKEIILRDAWCHGCFKGIFKDNTCQILCRIQRIILVSNKNNKKVYQRLGKSNGRHCDSNRTRNYCTIFWWIAVFEFFKRKYSKIRWIRPWQDLCCVWEHPI